MTAFMDKDTRNDGLRTDLYQLTMAAGYHCRKMHSTATFELFNRKLLPNRGYHIACGLELALRYLEGLKFSARDIAAIQRHPSFRQVDQSFFDYLENFRFTGDVWALPEGTPYFPGEPVLRVTAPIIEAQIVETYLLSIINFQTLIASKAARIVDAAQGRSVVDFGTRRAHGPEAGELAARAAYIAGAIGTSNVEAATSLDIPAIGTYAHSWVMAFEDEAEAFRAYHKVFPQSTTHLIDTYDPIEGTKKLCSLGIPVKAVRIDSGDLAEMSRQIRQILDSAGFKDAKIVASSDLDEDRIAELIASGAPIDTFGVGTRLVTSFDRPALGGVYKLVEQEDAAGGVHYRMKYSPNKLSIPGKKQVWRVRHGQQIVEDIIGLAEESGPEQGEALLVRVMADGVRLSEAKTLQEIREYCLSQRQALAADVRALNNPTSVKTRYSKTLLDLVERVSAKTEARAAISQ